MNLSLLDLTSSLMTPRVIVPVVGGLSLVGGLSVIGLGAAFYVHQNIDRFVAKEKDASCDEVYELPGKVPVLGHFPALSEIGDFNLNYFKEVNSLHRTVRFSLPFAPSIYWTSDPAVIKRILQTGFREGKYQKPDLMLSTFKDFLGNGIFLSNGDQWKSKRKMAANLFRHHNLKSYVDIFVKNSRNFVNVVKETLHRNDEDYQRNGIDFQDYFMRYTLDSFCEIGFGVNINSLNHSNHTARKFQRAFDYVQTFSDHRGRSGELWRIKEYFWKDAEFRSHLNFLNEFVRNIIAMRKEESEEQLEGRVDLLSQLLLHKVRSERGRIDQETEYEEITDDDLRDWIMNFLIAGRDTTAILLTFCTYQLSLPENAKYHQQVMDEIAELYESYQFNDPSAPARTADLIFDQITFESQKNQKAMKKVMQETLRLYPPVPLDGYSALEDDIIETSDGKKISVKKGTLVLYSAWTTHRQEYNFVEPEKFNPDRFESPIIPFSFVPFHGGPRVCLGQDMAYLEAKILMTCLLSNFTFEPVGEVVLKQAIILSSKTGVRFHVHLKE